MTVASHFSPQQKVLIVDKLASARKLIIRSLQNLGIPEECIEQAENGEAGFDLLQQGKISLIISDWTMPGVSGHELFDALKSARPKVTIPFIAIAAPSEKDAVLKALNGYPAECVVKPFTPEIVGKKVQALLESVTNLTSATNGNQPTTTPVKK